MKIEALHVYPVKGCAGQLLSSVNVTSMGLEGDREFALTVDGERVNQKALPALRQLQAHWQGKPSAPDAQLMLSYPGHSPLTVSVGGAAKAAELSFFRTPAAGLDMGDEVADWLSAALAANARMVRVKEPIAWPLPLPGFEAVQGQPQTKFVDLAPLLLTNLSSLDDLNGRLSDPVAMDRFRANIVVSGMAPYQEDLLAAIELPGIALQALDACERCAVVTRDPQTGVGGKEPLRTLSQYRRRSPDYAGGVVFGQYLTALQDGELSVGLVGDVSFRS